MTTTEQDRAQMEAERHVSMKEYFVANPTFDFGQNRNSFTNGYRAGWNERNKKVIELQARIASLQEQLEQLSD